MSVPGPAAVSVVFDVNVLAVAVGESPFRSGPSPPPTSGNPSADCLGAVNDTAEFALWFSPHILAKTGRMLATVLKTPDQEVDDYLRALAEMAEASGGGITGPARGQHPTDSTRLRPGRAGAALSRRTLRMPSVGTVDARGAGAVGKVCDG